MIHRFDEVIESCCLARSLQCDSSQPKGITRNGKGLHTDPVALDPAAFSDILADLFVVRTFRGAMNGSGDSQSALSAKSRAKNIEGSY